MFVLDVQMTKHTKYQNIYGEWQREKFLVLFFFPMQKYLENEIPEYFEYCITYFWRLSCFCENDQVEEDNTSLVNVFLHASSSSDKRELIKK